MNIIVFDGTTRMLAFGINENGTPNACDFGNAKSISRYILELVRVPIH